MHPMSEQKSFEVEAHHALQGVQRALAGVITEAVEPAGTRLTDISEWLGIDTKLAWKLTRIVELRDPFSAGLYVPGASGMRIVLNAAESRGASPEVLKTLSEAYTQFEHVQKVHAGDRRTMDMLLSGLAEQESERHQIRARRAAFQANTELWGVAARARLMTFVVWPSSDDQSRIQMAHVAGMFGVQRTRLDVPWRVAHARAEDDAGEASQARAILPLDPAVKPGEPPILSSHTSSHAPPLVPTRTADDRTEYRLGPGPIGRRSHFDLVIAEYSEDAGDRYKSPAEKQLSIASRNRTPAELLVLDLVISNDLYGAVTPTPSLVSELWGERSASVVDDPERLPIFEEVRRVGRGLTSFQHPRVTRHRELMASVFDARGIDPEAFDTYRVEMVYPPSPTATRIAIPLPDAPQERAVHERR